MTHAKLQFGCLIIVLYIMAIYIKETLHKKIGCNRLFDLMMGIAPWAILLDGATAVMVNYLDEIPAWVNLTVHCLFYLSMTAFICVSFLYMVDKTVGMPHKAYRWVGLFLPTAVAVGVILGFLPQTYYVIGKHTNYSMGPSVIACYVSLVFHFGLIIGLLIIKRRTIEKHKLIGFSSFLFFSLAVLVVQVFIPEVLLSALFPTFILLGAYLFLEDPAIRQLSEFNDEMIAGFATLVENRDDSTGGHIKRTKGYVAIILKHMKHRKEFRSFLTKDYIEDLLQAAPMHDIGKIATPDTILQKPGKLTPEEFEIMKLHAPKGGEIILETFKDIDDPNYLKIAYEVARFHHEKWNGRGYPEGLSGINIPLHARIMAIADVFDAVSAKRCYRDAMPLDQCFKIIEEGLGRDFDPVIGQIFLDARDEVTAFYEANKDTAK